MNVLVIGGTLFIGPPVVRRLVAAGHQTTVFHRGQTTADLPAGVNHVLGDRHDLTAFLPEFKQLALDVVVDMICYNEADALQSRSTFSGIAERLVMLSSMDVYREYGRFVGLESGVPEGPFDEDSPLRESRFPYRNIAKVPQDFAYTYDKIPAEEVVLNESELKGTVLRLPAVYGPGDLFHRMFEYLKRMDDGRERILIERRRAHWRWTRGYVENVAAAIALAVSDSRAAGRVYNVGEEFALSEAEWARAIGDAAGWSGEIVEVAADDLPAHLALPYNWDHHIHGDTGRIRKDLGYVEPIARSEALKATVDWERAHPPSQIQGEQFDYAGEDACLAKIDRTESSV
jgi:nucleoside-diphosphate-sugar epimerase